MTKRNHQKEGERERGENIVQREKPNLLFQLALYVSRRLSAKRGERQVEERNTRSAGNMHFKIPGYNNANSTIAC